jgi:hypothetical protein
LHLRGIGLEGKISLMFVKRKLGVNSHMPNKGIYIINIPMTNYPSPSTHQSLDPLCIPFSVPQPNLGNINQNISYEKTPINATPSRSPHVLTTPLGVVIQFKVSMVESYVPLNH